MQILAVLRPFCLFLSLLVHCFLLDNHNCFETGEHESCGLWCKSEDNGYRPKNLPYGKPLSSMPLQSALADLFQKYAAKADDLVKMGSTQGNENFNHMVSRHLSDYKYDIRNEWLEVLVSAKDFFFYFC